MKGAIIPCSSTDCHNSVQEITPNWQKQLAQSFTDPIKLLNELNLTTEQMGNGQATALFKLRVPAPYVERMKKGDPQDPLLRQVWPAEEEFKIDPLFSVDPLNESSSNPVPGLLHKYGSRVLTISAASCAINCRYCFRRHFNYSEQSYSESAWQQWAEYIQQHPQINEVILSGGDPLLLSDKKLTRLHELLITLPQIKRLRIHSRIPLVLPERISPALMALASNSPLQWVLVWHVNHPSEIDGAVIEAMHRCQKAGITQFNQSVLLKGINDSVSCLQQLSDKLFSNNVQPYYLHLLDRVQGVAHFEVEQQEAIELHRQLQRSMSGYLVPKLVRELPGEASKTSVNG